MFCVYEHLLDGKVFWVGSGDLNRPRKFSNRSDRWKRYVQDRTKEVEVKIIKQFENYEDAYKYEIELSKKLRQNNEPIQGLIGKYLDKEAKQKCSNCFKGRHHTDEAKIKISEKKKGVSLSEEHKNNLSKSHKGKPSNWKGHHFTEEQKKLISERTKEGIKKCKERRMSNDK